MNIKLATMGEYLLAIIGTKDSGRKRLIWVSGISISEAQKKYPSTMTTLKVSLIYPWR
jgi:hypothetical protein